MREVRFAHLDAATASDLIQRPTPDFPEGTLPAAVAEQIMERTGNQPFLVQLYAQLFVELLNDAGRVQASPEDLEQVEQEVLEQARNYFLNTWQRGPEPAQAALAALARGETPKIDRIARRWLARRALIHEDGGLTIPVLGRFLIEEELAD